MMEMEKLNTMVYHPHTDGTNGQFPWPERLSGNGNCP